MENEFNPQEIIRFRPSETGRITALLNFYHQQPNENPVQHQFISDVPCTSQDELFSKKQTIGSEWTALSLGWLDPASIAGYIVHNRTGENRAINPTEQERLEDASAVLEISLPSGLVIPPKRFAVIWLSQFAALNVRSLGAPARIQYILVPK